MKKLIKVTDVAAGGKHTLFLTGKSIQFIGNIETFARNWTSIRRWNEQLWPIGN